MTLRELIQCVNEKKLSKDDLEMYRDDVSYVAQLLYLEAGELEKEEALFLDASEEKTDIAKKRKWKASEKGQRLITVKSNILSAKELLRSLRDKLYAVY